MSLNQIMRMRELELESEDETKLKNSSQSDSDSCDDDEINKLFIKCSLIAQKSVTQKQYILQIAGTSESEPNIALSLSNNNCDVYNLSNNQLAKLTSINDHQAPISEIKFSRDNSNLLYTGSNDGSIKLWDLRSPEKSVSQLKDSTAKDKLKQITCFDISPNNILLSAGTNLFDGDAFILFWDLRNSNLLGGYWESHTDDITQVKFHPTDSNRLISGSVDGLINLYELSQNSEEDALIDSLNTESSIEKLTWIQTGKKDIISCITHVADIQFWNLDDAQPYLHLHRNEIAQEIKRKSEDHVYIVDVFENLYSVLVLAGSNYNDGECLRGLSITGNTVKPSLQFPENKQRVRTSWFNPKINLLLTGGEKGILNAWEMKPQKN